MRKFIAILFAVFYVTSVSGVTLKYHYCGGKLSSVSISLDHDDHDCSCGSKKMKKNCCKNHNLEVKVSGEHETAAQQNITTQFSSTLVNPLTSLPGILPCIQGVQSPVWLIPFRPGNSLLVMNSVFRI